MISNVMFWSDHRCFDQTVMQRPRESVIMRGLPVYSLIQFTCEPCKPGNVIGLSSVNPVGKKQKMISITILFTPPQLVETMILLKTCLTFIRQTDQLLLVTQSKRVKGAVSTRISQLKPFSSPPLDLWGIAGI